MNHNDSYPEEAKVDANAEVISEAIEEILPCDDETDEMFLDITQTKKEDIKYDKYNFIVHLFKI